MKVSTKFISDMLLIIKGKDTDPIKTLEYWAKPAPRGTPESTASSMTKKYYNGRYPAQVKQIKEKKYPQFARFVLSKYIRIISDNPPSVYASDQAMAHNVKANKVKTKNDFNKIKNDKAGKTILWWEHLVPIKDLIDKLVSLPSINDYAINNIMKNCVVAVITIEEDKKLPKHTRANPWEDYRRNNIILTENK